MFWWKRDSEKYGSNFRRWWRFSRAYKEGVLDFYMTSLLLIGGFTLIYGIYRGNKNGTKFDYQEKVNEIKLKELDLEMERVQILMEINEIEEQEE